ncbi:MAG: RagB/SusD family nutrient uptake outer membrane protein [Chitinophagaceae bacterium]
MYKNIIRLVILCISGLVLSLSCNKANLDIEPSFVTEDSYFQNETEFTRGVLGVYAKMSDLYWYNGGGNNGTHPVFLLPGDDITCSDQEEFEQFGQLQPSSGRINYFYRTLYQMIARANVMLEKVKGVEAGIYTTPNLQKYHEGEAYFLRGLAYFYLANYYGTSPLVTERVTLTSQFTPPGTTGTQLLDQSILDFTTSAGLLPLSWDPTNRGRATSNAANGMLGKALVFRGTIGNIPADFTAAITAFNKISGVSLAGKFDDNFAADTENNNESLFEFQATQPFGFDNVWLDNDFDNAIGSLSAFWGFYNNSWALFGKSRFYATTKLLAAFDAGDPRLALSLDAANRNFRKYVTRDKVTQSGVSSANNPRILRYADVLLLKAEALLYSGGSKSESINLINQVRGRARNMVTAGTVPADRSITETNTDQIFNWLNTERFLELSGEGSRWLDLRRWHIAKRITLNNAFFSSNTSTVSFQDPKHLLFPIPNSELDLNPNVKQNAGY